MRKKLFKNILSLSCAAIFITSCEKDLVAPNTGTLITTSQTLNKLAVNNNLLYTTTDYDVDIFDISNSGMPTLKNSKILSAYLTPATLLSYQNLLFTGLNNGLNIYNTSGNKPFLLSNYNAYKSCNPLITNGSYLFILLQKDAPCAALNNELDVVDITDPTKPRLSKTYVMSGPTGFALDGNKLFICDKVLKYYDITDPNNLVLKQTLSIKASQVTVLNGVLTAIGDDGLVQYDYNGSTLTQLSKLNLK